MEIENIPLDVFITAVRRAREERRQRLLDGIAHVDERRSLELPERDEAILLKDAVTGAFTRAMGGKQ